MSDPTLAAIYMGGWNFAPRGFAFCNGQILPIAQNQALFSLLGTMYGGDGRTTFALPDCRGRMTIGRGNGPGLTPRSIGQKPGVETVTLTASQIPSHNHMATGRLHGSTAGVDDNSPVDELFGTTGSSNSYAVDAGNADAILAPNSVGGKLKNKGGNQSHPNMPPFQAISYVISLTGVFPSRS